MKLGITIPYSDDTRAASVAGSMPREMVVEYARQADRLGYDTIWVAEAYGWDAFTVLTQLACSTQRVGLASGIVNVFSRSPALIAQSAASLDAISGGRFTLGLGTSGHQVISGWHGVAYERAIRRLRETVEIVRMVLRRERLTYDGEIFKLAGGLKLITHPIRPHIPIYLATLTPSGIELAGEIADGWLPVFFSPRHWDSVIKPPLERGAAKAGRPVSDCSVCVFQSVVVTDDRKAGRDAVRPHLALYIGGMGSRERNYYNRLFCAYGFEEDAQRIQELYLERRKDEAMAVLSDEIIDLVTIIGSVEECRERIEGLATVGVDEVTLALQVPGGDPLDLMAALKKLAPR